MPDREKFNCPRCGVNYNTKCETGISTKDGKEVCINCCVNEVHSQEFMGKYMNLVALNVMQDLFMCKRCGACCKYTNVALYDDALVSDVRSLEKATGKKRHKVMRKHTEFRDGKLWLKNVFPCEFYGSVGSGTGTETENEKGCTIYKHRPGNCKAFPLIVAAREGANVISLGDTFEDGSFTCPAISELMTTIGEDKDKKSGINSAKIEIKMEKNSEPLAFGGSLLDLVFKMAKYRYHEKDTEEVANMVMDMIMEKLRGIQEGALESMYLDIKRSR